MVMPPSPPEPRAPGLAQALARLATDKDQAAWALLIALMADPLTGLLIRVTGDRSVAEDAVQETFLLLRDHAGAFRSDASRGDADTQARHWVLRVAVNTALKLPRHTTRLRGTGRRAALRAHELAGDRSAPGDAVDRHEQFATLRRELTLLPEVHAQVLTFHFLAGQELAELADQLGIPSGTARTRLDRGLEALRARLSRSGTALTVAAVTGLLTELGAQHVGGAAAPATLGDLLASTSTATITFTAPTGARGALSGSLTAALLVLGLALSATVMIAITSTAAPVPSPLAPQVPPRKIGADRVSALDDARIGMDKVIALAIAHGFPDTREATFFSGSLRVIETGPSGPKATPYSGVHALLPDGTWLIVLAHRLKVGAVANGQVGIDWLGGQKRLGPPDQGESLLRFRPGVSRSDRPLTHTHHLQDFPFLDLGETGLVGGSSSKGMGCGGAAFAALLRAGREALTDDSRDVLVALAKRKDVYPGLMPLDLCQIGLPDGTMRSTWRAKPDYTRLRNPTQVLAYALADWFASQLEPSSPPFERLPPRQALDGALALIPPEDSVARLQVIERAQAAGLPAPASPRPGADEILAQRLHDWRTEPDMEGIEAYEQQWAVDGRDADHHSENTQRCIELGIASRFDRADLPALSAALTDQRLSGWREYGRAHTIGDQALRAIVAVLGFDPRALIGQDPQAVWTSDGREMVARSLIPWLRTHAQDSLAHLRAEALPRLDWRSAAYLLKVAPVAEAPALFAQWAQQWRTHPPEDFDDGYLLLCGSSTPEFLETTRAWPVTGPAGPLIATWQAKHGVTTGIITCIADTLQADLERGTRKGVITGAFLPLAFAAQPEAIRHLQGILSGDPTSLPARRLMGACMVDSHSSSSPISRLVEGDYSTKVRALYAVLALQLLWDERPAPAELAESARLRANQMSAQTQALRICDCAAVSLALCDYLDHAGVTLPQGGSTCDLAAALPHRDLQIRAIRTALFPHVQDLQAELQVPLVIPGVPVAQDGKGTADF